MIRLAVIGMGKRATVLTRQLYRQDQSVKLAAVVDPDPEQVRARLRDAEIPHEDARFLNNLEPILEQADAYDAFVIGTRCNLHTPIAIKLAQLGRPLLLEKPVGISGEQLEALSEAFEGHDHQVVVSFPLRFTPLLCTVRDFVHSGRLGTINQLQAVNYVPYGGTYYANFYREHEITGGLWLQKATHDFDYINMLLGETPTAVAATSTQRIYGGNMPHDLRCSQCHKTRSCPESPQQLALRGNSGGVPNADHLCVFGENIRNQDAGSALLTYPSGINTCYSQNFVARRSAGRRGAVITGYRGTLRFDWQSSSITIIDHHDERVDKISVKAAGGHMGGDQGLIRHFLDVIRDGIPSSCSLHDGLVSAMACLAARESVATQMFQAIDLSRLRSAARPAVPS